MLGPPCVARRRILMPTLITRDEALRRIVEEGRRPACLMCAIVERKVGDVHVVYEDDETLVMLPRYVKRWGHVMVVPKPHVTSFSGVDGAVWARTTRVAHQAARTVERAMHPLRCYMASTGSSAGELTQTSMHLHMHVIPLFEPDDRPAEVFTWADGVLVGEPDEWAELRRRYRAVWDDCAV
jgi:diadenosine tetraphosphate (Ap4A) HIT family hydrolase